MSGFNKEKLVLANKKTFKGIVNILPIILGILLLVSIINVIVPKSIYKELFSGNMIFDTLKGSLLGSILTGNPITAYILGDGFLQNEVSLFAVTSFIVAWTTVGVVQLPAETYSLGKSFALYRNLTAFVFSILVAIISVLLINLTNF
jgi:uncharacterized membrane protein YraQ (UPF0718 family)